jgi:hypothetical protein
MAAQLICSCLANQLTYSPRCVIEAVPDVGKQKTRCGLMLHAAFQTPNYCTSSAAADSILSPLLPEEGIIE